MNEWEEKFFWTPQPVKRKTRKSSIAPEEEQGSNGDGSESNSSNVAKKENQETGTENKDNESSMHPPLGERLLSMVIDLLFLSGFTIPTNIATETRINYVIWETGVGSAIPIGSSKEHDLNKTETLRLLLTLLSKPMYLSGANFMTKEIKSLKYMVLKTERKVVLALLCSLLNTVVKYNPSGWGVPYNYMVFTDAREMLVTLCLQVLLVLLNYRDPTRRVSQGNDSSGSGVHRRDSSIETISSEIESLSMNPLSPTSNSQATRDPSPRDGAAGITSVSSDPVSTKGRHADNAFRYYTSKLHRSQDFQFLTDGIYRILSNPMQANNTYLPGSTKPIHCHQEMLMLCWNLLEINERFRTYLLETDRVLDVLVVLLYYALENKLEEAQLGLVRMCAFILQTISADRNFGVKLNKTFEGHGSLPSNVRIQAFHGTYADFMIISIYALIATTRGTLNTLYPALILTITNVSPFLKNLSVVSSAKLVQLFKSFSAPGFLLAEEGNHKLVGYMLEAFSNIVQYQFSDNPHVVYAIIRVHKIFEDLSEFTLSKGLLEIRRVQAIKEERKKHARNPSLNKSAESEVKNVSQDRGSQTVLPDNENSSHHRHQHQQQSEDHDDFNEKSELIHDSHGIQTENASAEEGPGHLSEKARGKLPEGVTTADRRQSGDSANNNNIIVTPFSVGKSGFVATEDWVSSWHSKLPSGTILILLTELVPKVQSLCGAQSHTTEQEVLEFLRTVTLVGILPPPQPLFLRHFQWSEASVVWFSSFLWGQIYLAGANYFGIFNGTQVKLFLVKTVVKEDRIKNALGSAVGGVQGVIDRFTTAPTSNSQNVASSMPATNVSNPVNSTPSNTTST